MGKREKYVYASLPSDLEKKINSLSKDGLRKECRALHKNRIESKWRLAQTATAFDGRARVIAYYLQQLALDGVVMKDTKAALELVSETLNIDCDSELSSVEVLSRIITSLVGAKSILESQEKAIRAIIKDY